jgi:UDP-glucose 4-epimerase
MLGSILVTGGAGFIGSHLVDKLMDVAESDVYVLDNLSAGKIANISHHFSKKCHFIRNDLRDNESYKNLLNDMSVVCHMAANPDVRTGFEQPEISYNENIRNTFLLLEAIRRSNVKTILFASSSTVYGEPSLLPTPENYGPLFPISPYGASKLACEGLISSYCATYGIKGLIFRFANIVGSRATHGVILDFINKLKMNNGRLEVLGDGTQSKSYVHVSDCVNCFLLCLSKSTRLVDIYNVGNEDDVDVITIAKTVCNKMGFSDAKISLTGGVDNGRGWVGDVKKMHLDITKLMRLGWRPTYSSSLAIELACSEILIESGRKN